MRRYAERQRGRNVWEKQSKREKNKKRKKWGETERERKRKIDR